MSEFPKLANATFANNGSLATAVELGGMIIAGMVIPSGWTSAVVTFQVSCDGGSTYKDLYTKDNAEVSFTVTADKALALNSVDLGVGWTHVKVRSGTSASPSCSP